jgi:hypothetical protein
VIRLAIYHSGLPEPAGRFEGRVQFTGVAICPWLPYPLDPKFFALVEVGSARVVVRTARGVSAHESKVGMYG